MCGVLVLGEYENFIARMSILNQIFESFQLRITLNRPTPKACQHRTQNIVIVF